MLSAKQLVSKIKMYAPEANTDVVELAYQFAQKAHEGQMRHSGDPYFSHCVATARQLVNMQLDVTTVVAGLLHDVPEDTEISLEEIRAQFGEDVAFLVDGVTKLGKVRMSAEQVEQHSSEEPKDKSVTDRELAAVENLRKMFLAMAEDIRVVLIKLADRLHNMQTLDAIPAEKQRRIAKETMEIYAPLAERLGMGEVRGELQDLAFKYVDPEGYAWISKAARPEFRNTEKYLRRVMRFVERELATHKIEADVHGRNKHLYSLYKKIQSKGRDFSDVYDLVAVRILVDDVPDCYEVLGLLHQHWKPLLGRIKDYIALPKPNGYQSLHTTVFCIDGRVVEFQIRTHQMHREAEFGIAAHWSYSQYKESPTDGRRLGWVQQLAKWQAEVASNRELLEELRIDAFKHRIFVFTPRGEVKDLPNGATPLDFAYSIHTKVGENCAGAKVNGKLVSLSTALINGDMVEILTSSRAKPNQGWLDMVVTSGARSHIRRYLREAKASEEAVAHEKHPSVLAEPVVPPPSSAAPPIKLRPDSRGDGTVVVDGGTGYLVRLAKCCKPTVGDSIVGIVTIGKGVSVHQRWCANVRHVSDRGRLIRVAWSDDDRQRVDLRVEVYDKQGLTRDIANILARRGVHIVGIAGEVLDEGIGTFNLTVDLPRHVTLDTLTMDLMRHKSIYAVDRR